MSLNFHKKPGHKSQNPTKFVKKMGFFSHRFKVWLSNLAPKGLYRRTLLIIILPLVLLQIVMVFVFMERHWDQVTRRLSFATVKNIAAVIEVYENFGGRDNLGQLISMAKEKMDLSVMILPHSALPTKRQKPFVKILDNALSADIKRRINKPFWLDTIGRSSHVEVRFLLDDVVMQILILRNQTYASNSHIFLVWMVATSFVLLVVALLFLRNQIRPILALAQAAEAFGKGRAAPQKLEPKGATEIKRAAIAFNRMRNRIERHVDQRTTLLAGVSHDLRTILTRMKLELAFRDEDDPSSNYLRDDVDEMFHMLEDYMAFAKGVGTEENKNTNIRILLEKTRQDMKRMGKHIDLDMRDGVPLFVNLRPNAMKRAINNLTTNAVRLADRTVMSAFIKKNHLYIVVEDDGPGIPEQEREDVFHPFHRLDHARNQNEGNAGLGLAISRDIAHAHGGDITLDESTLGGLRAQIKIPI